MVQPKKKNSTYKMQNLLKSTIFFKFFLNIVNI
jgi:hypothetical protein